MRSGCSLAWVLASGCIVAKGPTENGELPGDSAEPIGWAAVSVGLGEVAAISSTGGLACWGLDYDPFPPGKDCAGQPRLVEVSEGYIHGCGLTPDGSAACWGGYPYETADEAIAVGQADPPPGHFHGLSAGAYQTCALDDDDAIVCWGLEDPRHAPPHGSFQQISMSTNPWGGFGCGLRDTGVLACWGFPPLDLPDGGPWVSISSGFAHVCVLDEGGVATCKGNMLDSWDETPKDVAFRSISAGGSATCGILEDQSVQCWVTGDWKYGGWASSFITTERDFASISLSAGGSDLVGITDTSQLVVIAPGGMGTPPSDPPP